MLGGVCQWPRLFSLGLRDGARRSAIAKDLTRWRKERHQTWCRKPEDPGRGQQQLFRWVAIPHRLQECPQGRGSSSRLLSPVGLLRRGAAMAGGFAVTLARTWFVPAEIGAMKQKPSFFEPLLTSAVHFTGCRWPFLSLVARDGLGSWWRCGVLGDDPGLAFWEVGGGFMGLWVIG